MLCYLLYLQDTSLDDSGLISDSSESDDLYDSDDSDFEQRLTQGKQKHKKAKDAAIDPESLNTARSLLNIFVANLNSEVSVTSVKVIEHFQ